MAVKFKSQKEDFGPRGHLTDYLPTLRGHLTEHYLPHLVHVVFEGPPASKYDKYVLY